MRREKRNAWITMSVFLTMLFGVAVATALNPVREFSENENRTLAQKPRLSAASFTSGKFSKEYEEFVTDQFVGRDQWITLKSMTELAMQKKEINGVYFAKDGYLIEKHTASEFKASQLTKNSNRLGDMVRKYEKKLGKGHVKVMLVPTASEVLADKLPANAPSYDQDLILNRVKKAVPSGTYVDVKRNLLAHKEEYVYYKTDHHWTSLGAYYGYEAWAKSGGLTPLKPSAFTIKTATDQFFGTIYSKVNVPVKPDQIKLYQIKKNRNYQVDYDLGSSQTKTLYSMKQLKGKDKYAVYLDGNHAVVKINTNVKNKKKLLIVKDSYAHTAAPFLVNHYTETHMIDFRYFNIGIEDYIKQNKITDVLYLYNTINFAKDTNTMKLLK